MNKSKGFSGILSVILLSGLMFGCAGTAKSLLTVDRGVESFQGSDMLILPEARPDIFDVIAEVGQLMQYRVTALDKIRGYVQLSVSNNALAQQYLGRVNMSQFMILVHEGGMKLQINIVVSGNFGNGGREKATGLLETFKSTLLKRVNKGMATS